MSTQTHAAVARAINAGQRERTTGHSPGQLMPILDHSRGLGTETIPTPQLLGAAWDNAVQHGPDPPAPRPGQRYYADVAGQLALEVRGKSQTGLQHLFCTPDGAESHLSPTPKRDVAQIRATPMLSPQSRAPELPPKSPLPHNRTRQITGGHCVVWGLQKIQTGQRITVPW